VTVLRVAASAFVFGLVVASCASSLRGPDHGGRCGPQGVECDDHWGGCCDVFHRCAPADPLVAPRGACVYEGVGHEGQRDGGTKPLKERTR